MRIARNSELFWKLDLALWCCIPEIGSKDARRHIPPRHHASHPSIRPIHWYSSSVTHNARSNISSLIVVDTSLILQIKGVKYYVIVSIFNAATYIYIYTILLR